MSEREIKDPLLQRLGNAVDTRINAAATNASQWDASAQRLLDELEVRLFTELAAERKSATSKVRHLSRSRPMILGALAASIAVVALIFSGGPSPAVSSASAFLVSAAKTALAEPAIPALLPGEYYYEPTVEFSYEGCQKSTTPAGLVELSGSNGTGPILVYVSRLERDEWSARDDGGAIQTTYLGGNFATTADHAAWENEGAPSIAGCEAPTPSGTISPPSSGGKGVGYLPTNAETLGALLAEGRIDDEGQVSSTSHCTTGSSNVVTNDDTCSVTTQFDIVSNLLGQAEGPSIVGPALYKILAQLPGVEEIGTLTNAYGESGRAIEDPSSGDVFVINPTSGALIEQEQLATATTMGGAFPAGSVRSSVSYGPLSVVNSLGMRPSKTTQGTD